VKPPLGANTWEAPLRRWANVYFRSRSPCPDHAMPFQQFDDEREKREYICSSTRGSLELSSLRVSATVLSRSSRCWFCSASDPNFMPLKAFGYHRLRFFLVAGGMPVLETRLTASFPWISPQVGFPLFSSEHVQF
jgi:hypothetical protein